MIHAFSQVLVGAGLVCALGLWRHHARIGTALRVAVALAAAVAFVALVGAPYTRAIAVFGEPALDPQGAIRFLPTFQAGLFVALWLAAFGGSGWQRFVGGAVLLAAAQIGVAAGVQLLVIHPAVVPLVRAWAIVAPVLVIAAVVNVAPARL